MTITVDIRPEVHTELARQAAARGRPVEAYAASLLEEAVHLPGAPAWGNKTMPPAKRGLSGTQQKRASVWLILGPSGAGKSSFGKWLATNQNWLHLEIDPPEGGDGIDLNNRRREWDEFYPRGRPQLLGDVIRQRVAAMSKVGCVLTFSGCLVLPPESIVGAARIGIRTIYLYGSAAHCITAFLNREQKNLGLDHWILNNYRNDTYIQMSKPALAPYRIHVFTHMGTPRPHVEVFEELLTGERQ